MPTVSVVIPNYNHAPYLQQRIESVLEQTFQDFEIILLDDSSTDGSQDILQRYATHPKVSHLVINSVNGGAPFAQWTKGFTLARGEWVWVAESDDWAESTFLEEMLASTTPQCALVACDSMYANEQGDTLWTPNTNGVDYYEGADYIRRRIAACNPIANVSGCLLRRSFLHQEHYSLYSNMRLCGDWMLYLLLAEQGGVVELHRPLNHYRQHTANTSTGAEHEGLTFLEGVHILDRLRTRHHLPTSKYARQWGRLWARYGKQYQIPHAVRCAIVRRLCCHYPSILFYHQLYHLKQWLA